MPYIKIASEQDAKELSQNLRKEDLDEIKANANANPYHALVSGVKYSHLPLAIMNDENKPIMIMGVVSHGKQLGLIWLLSYQKLNHIICIFTQLQRCIGLFLQSYPVLYNYIDARNTLHLNWLKWLGFSFIKVHEHFGYEKENL